MKLYCDAGKIILGFCGNNVLPETGVRGGGSGGSGKNRISRECVRGRW